MNRKKTLLTSSTLLAVALAVTGCSSTATTGSGGSGMNHSGSSASTSASFDDQDVQFAQMMLPHHKQAIEMSDMLLAKGAAVDSGVASLATKIKREQSPEIVELTGWLKKWNTKASSGMGHSMTGMMSDGDMAALDKSSASDAGKLFLTQMIQHHTGAIDMAATELSKGKNADATALAKSIVSSQSAEITQMKDMLASM